MARPQLMFASKPVPRHSDEPLRVGIVSDNPLRRAALMMRLSGFDDLALIELATSADIRADAIVCDGLGCDAASPVLCLVDDPSKAAEAMRRGAAGVLLRDSAPRRVHAAIHAVAEGMLVIEEEGAEQLLRQPRMRIDLIEPLTEREQQVAQLLAGGLTNKEIAQRLGITVHTVKFHLNGILRKLGVSTRTEAVVRAARLGLVIL